MDPSTVCIDDPACKLVDKPELEKLLGKPTESVNRFIAVHRQHFIDLNPDGERRYYVIPRARLDRILVGDIDPLERALASPRPSSRRVRKPRKQHV